MRSSSESSSAEREAVDEMSLFSTQVSKDYLFARLHGLWADGVNGEVRERLMQSPHLEALQYNLKPYGIDITHRESMHLSLAEREYNRLTLVWRALDSKGDGAYYRAFMGHLYFQNLGALLTLRFFPQDETRDFFFATHRTLPTFEVESLLKIREDEEFLNQIPLYDGLTRGMLQAVWRGIQKHRSVLVQDAALDRLFYSNLLQAASHASYGVRRGAVLLVSEEIDLENLSLLMRNAMTYHLEESLLEQLLLDGGGLLKGKVLHALCHCQTLEALHAVLPEPYHHVTAPFVASDIYLCENALWNHLYKEALRLFRQADAPANSLAAFPYLNHFESMNIERIYEAVYFGMPTREIRNLLIG